MALKLFRGLDEAASRKPTIAPPTPQLVGRRGFVTGIPLGGATETNPGQSNTPVDRQSFMESMLQAYLSCPWSAACIDVIARTATAGGIQVAPNAELNGASTPDLPPDVQKVQSLLDWVNDQDDIRQLMRNVITDLHIFGDSFTEVVWLLGQPVGLYSLDPTTMIVLADEHGIVTGYCQKMSTGKKVWFAPHEVIHVRFDAPGSGLYGVSPTQKNTLPIQAWLYTMSLVSQTMKKGDPIRAHVDWPMGLPESEIKRAQQQYAARNLGALNSGNLFETKGGTHVQEMGVNQTEKWLLILQQRRDEILSGYGVPPSKVGVIEAGNIGSGTGTSQERGFMVNTIGPISEIVMEKFSSALLVRAYGITDWHLKFASVDWRDDKVLEDIRDQRLRNGSWSLNRYKSDIGETPVPGGDQSVLVERQIVIDWEDIDAYSKAEVAALVQTGTPAPPPPTSASKSSPAPAESVEELEERFHKIYTARRDRLLQDA